MNKFKLSLLGCLIGVASPMLHAATAGQSMVNPQSGVVVGYWHNWCGGEGYQRGTAPCVKLNQIHPQYNVVDVSFMKVYGSSPIPTFILDPATGMSESQFIEQIATLNSQGRAVLLALGGADAHIELRTGQEQAFADEIIRLVETYGFDGLDIDLEQTAITAANNQTVIPAALRLVKDHYRAQGKNFLITMAPEFPYLKETGAYTPYLKALEGYYDWINPQFYNQGGDGIWIDGVGWIAQNNDALKEEFIYYMADSLINGSRGYYKIPHDKLVFGIPTNIDAAATGYVKNPQDLFDAFNKLKSQGQPLRGVMTWSINWDMGRNAAGQSYNESFIKSYGPFIHDQNITPPPVENGKPVFSGLSNSRIKQGTVFDPMAGVTANDREDGDLTSQIQVEGSVDTQRIGLYPLTYKVSDRDNNVTEQVRTVEVYSMKPVFTGVTDTTIELGTPFDPMTGVSAHDEEDGDLTAQIKISGNVDSSKVGRYSLTYQVSDSAGQLVTQQRNVTVKEQGAICENSWDAKKVYVGGDIVSHNGKTWLAGWWTQNEEPGTTGEWGVWRVQGDSDCNGGNKPPVSGSSDFTVSAISSDYTIVNGQVSIRFNVTTTNPVQITATLEQNGRRHGATSTKVSGSATLVLQGSNVTDGSYEVVITGLADGQQAVVQRFPVALTEESSGGGEGDYPAYTPNTGYKAGDRVSNAGGNFECKPFPYSGWCSGASSHYAPGTGSNWSDAWTKL
ncbi:immunoglobulin-like domain-containing protein [Aeromonas sp. MdU4]|uniref:immunoglobulin-like domain-containing protein n=1 Tax=Aeromonas sp. MdU4 TaxID=3342819 RepID=UPI0035B776F8